MKAHKASGKVRQEVYIDEKGEKQIKNIITKKVTKTRQNEDGTFEEYNEEEEEEVV